MTLRIEGDDNVLDVMEKVNTLLKAHGLEFVNDGLPHDGFEIFELTKAPTPTLTCPNTYCGAYGVDTPGNPAGRCHFCKTELVKTEIKV